MSKRLFFTKMGWESDSLVEIERSIKLFSLINTDLIIPSNHIYSSHAEQLFRTYPELLEKEIIRPALGCKYSNYEAYLTEREHKAGRSLIEYGRYLDSLTSKPEQYSSDSPALIFTGHAISQINNAESVLTKASGLTKVDVARLNTEIAKYQNRNGGAVFFRDFLELSHRVLNSNSYNVFEKYAYLLRYTSGAYSKNCNNLLPQENLINWCLANPNNPEDFILQDEQLFWEVFIESMVKVTEGIFTLKDLDKLSPQLLDRLSFDDIQGLRNEVVLQDRFITKYNSIIDQINVIRASKDNRLELVDYEALIALKEELKKMFEEALIQESSVYVEIELLEALVRVAYQIWGGTFQTIGSVINFFSILFNRKKDLQKLLEQQEKRILKANKFITKKLGDEAVLIEYMDRLVLKTKEAWYK